MQIDIIEEGNYIYFDFIADGFLHNMIRILMGTILRVGKGELSPQDVKSILEEKNRSLAGPMLEGKGLCLMQIGY